MKTVCYFIEEESSTFPVKDLCQVLDVARSTYYRLVKLATESPHNRELKEEPTEVFRRHSRRYGSRRIEKELKASGRGIGRYEVSVA